MPANNCDGWRGIHPKKSDMDVMSDSLVAQILGHNRHGQRVCRWKP